MAPRVFRAPEGPAAREARRPRFARRRASKPARALRTLRRPPHQWGLVCCWLARRVGSKPGQAPQASRRPPIGRGVCVLPGQAPPPPMNAAAWPSGPSGALHTSGAGDADVWLARCPDAQLWLSISNFARNSSMTHSNFESASLELQRFCGVSKNDRDKLRARFGWRWCRYRPLRPSAPRASIGASSQSPAGHRRPHSAGWVKVRIREPRCPPAGPVRYLVSIRVGCARRAARRSRRSKAPDRDGGR